MSSIIRISDKFFNIRSKLVIGPADVKTHSSLVKRKNGKWLMLDSVTMENTVKLEVDNITRNGQDLEAVLNLHPFHTVRFSPHAKLTDVRVMRLRTKPFFHKKHARRSVRSLTWRGSFPFTETMT
jgi:hypothetical protein